MSLSEWKSSMPKRSLVQVDGKGDALEMPHSAVNPKQNDAPKNKAPLCAGLFYLRGGWEINPPASAETHFHLPPSC